MTVHSIHPAFVRVAIDNVKGVHYHTHPVREWIGTPFANAGTFEAWDSSSIAADTMIEAMIDDMLPLLADTSTVTGYDIYTMTDVNADPVPVFFKVLTGKVGTSVATGWFEALQRTYTLVTTAGNLVRKVILDEPASNDFDPVYSLGATVDATWIANFTDETNAWAGRDGFRPAAFRSLKFALNGKLKRNYGN